MPTMNIKDPRVHALARELAQLRGSSATAAVRAALEEALIRDRSGRVDRAQAMRRLQERAAATKHL
ncbi:MAG: type II toxin-antitoxin system VapB family antitoxin, partial [Micrococcus sp.]|nr:type II toxin-antitoxin system VapB family antitoxin [Micrococcus sp.]